MNILAIETSTKNYSLALSRDNGRIATLKIHLKKPPSSFIIPAIAKLLRQSRMSLGDLDGFAVGLVPGSFTSLRVGIATVKGLSFVIRKPVVGMSSLEVLAMNVAQKYQGQICVMCDAKRNLLYSCLYESQDGRLMQKAPYVLADISEVLKKINKTTLFVGNGIELFHKDILTHYQSRKKKREVLFADKKFWYPTARNLLVLSYGRFKNKDFDNADRLVPIYLYPDDCQIQQ